MSDEVLQDLLRRVEALERVLEALRDPPFEPGRTTRGPLQFRSGYPEGQRPPRKAPQAQARKRKKDDRRERKKIDRRNSRG